MISNKTLKIFAVVPAYNEEKKIGQVIEGLKKYISDIIVVNDGSLDKTAQIAKEKGVVLVSHCFNLGLGAALRTGFCLALEKGADIILTFDADGQHNPDDLEKVITPILKGQADVVIGTRLKGKGNMPLSRKIISFLASLFTYIFYGKWVSDSQSGLRAFKRQALEKIKLSSQKMEVSSEIIGQIKKHNLCLKEVPISGIYTSYSLSKGQKIVSGSVRIVWDVLISKLFKI
ncbi:glycosyltransferase family 2 protein [bacterium]|nr:glycosyltransferase family 2 protein [bacterium]